MPRPDQVQHQVLCRGGPPHRHAVSVDDIAVRQTLHLGEGRCEILKIFPMDSRAIAIQKPRPRHDPSPRIHPGDQPKARCHPP